MSQGNRIAIGRADELVDLLTPILERGTERFLFVGSVRRRRPTVGDLEAVIIERFMDVDLVALLIEEREAIGMQHVRGKLTRKLDRGVLTVTLAPKCLADPIQLELYLASPATWPLVVAIRTGPAAFSKSIVTPAAQGGRLMDGYRIHSGRLWHEATEAPIDLESERQFLTTYAGGWLEPADRKIS